MKHIKTFECYISSLKEGLTAIKTKELIDAAAESLAGQLSDEDVTASGAKAFLEENPNVAESTLEGMEDEYGVDLVSMYPKIKDDLINKVKEYLADMESNKATRGARVNEGINSKAKQLQSKFADAITVDQFGEGWDDEDEEGDRVNNIMKKLGTDAATTLFASDANDEEGYERFLAQVMKSGLKYEEAETVDGVQEIYIDAK